MSAHSPVKSLIAAPIAWCLTAALAIRSRLYHFALDRPEILRRAGGFRSVVWALRSAPKDHIPGILRAFGAEVGDNATIHPPLHIHGAREDFRNLRIGRNGHIGPDCFIDITGPVNIGDDVGISMRSTIISHYFPAMTWYYKGRAPESLGVTIGNGVHVTAGVTILDGVKIGDGAILLPGSVITSAVDPWTMAGGVPARPMRRKTPDGREEKAPSPAPAAKSGNPQTV